MSLYRKISDVREKIIEELRLEFGVIQVPQLDLLTLAEMRLQTVLGLSMEGARDEIEKIIEAKKKKR